MCCYVQVTRGSDLPLLGRFMEVTGGSSRRYGCTRERWLWGRRALRDRDVTGIRVADVNQDALAERFPETEAVALDYTDPSTFGSAVDGADRVLLIRPPAISRVGNTINPFLDAAESAGVEHVVFSSVAGAESNRIVPHHRIEAHLIDSGMAWTMLRPSFFAQNIATAYRQDINETDRIYVPAGDGLVAFIDAQDIAEVAAVCLSKPGTRESDTT